MSKYHVKWLTVFTLFSFFIMIFQNCGQSFESRGSSSQASFCKSQKRLSSPFAENKLILRQQTAAGQQKLGSFAGDFALLLDVQCTNQRDGINFMGQNIQIPQAFSNSRTYTASMQLGTGTDWNEVASQLDQSPCILGMTENGEVHKSQSAPLPNDPLLVEQGHLNFLGWLDTLSFQNRISANVIVAVIDTGVDYLHRDLNRFIWREPTTGARGINTIDPNVNALDDDPEGHGTHVAGIIAAGSDNNVGGIGLTNDYVQIMPVKALNSEGSGSFQAVANGIDYAVANGADIINLSVEGDTTNAVLEAAINRAINAGVFIVVAMGNNSQEVSLTNIVAPAYLGPTTSGLMTVASVNTSPLLFSQFSNYSRIYAEIAAPGAETSASGSVGGILSTLPNDRWGRITGTSQAVPMVVSGAAIIIGTLKSRRISYTTGAIEEFIRENGSGDNPAFFDRVSGGKVLNLKFLTDNLATYLQTASGPFTGSDTGSNCTIGR